MIQHANSLRITGGALEIGTCFWLSLTINNTQISQFIDVVHHPFYDWSQLRE